MRSTRSCRRRWRSPCTSNSASFTEKRTGLKQQRSTCGSSRSFRSSYSRRKSRKRSKGGYLSVLTASCSDLGGPNFTFCFHDSDEVGPAASPKLPKSLAQDLRTCRIERRLYLTHHWQAHGSRSSWASSFLNS